MSHNNLTALPSGICKLNYLKTIDISYNKLAQLPKNFGHLDDLEEMNLSNNSIANIPKSFGWLSKLRKLDLSKNSIKILIPELFYPSSNFVCPLLMNFNRTNIHLTNVLLDLETIDLSENQIVVIPEEAGDLMQLERLSLRQNKIANLVLFRKCCKLKVNSYF